MGIGPQNLGASGGKEGHTSCGHRKKISPFNKMLGGLEEEKKEKNPEVEGQEVVEKITPEQPGEEQPTEEVTETEEVVEEPSAVSKAYANQQQVDTSQPVQPGPPIPAPLTKVSEDLKEIRKKPGMSNAGRYNVKDYAGPNESYPINDIDRGRSAIKLAYKAGPKLEKQIKENVYKKYPSLEPGNKSKNA
jgi:hypothetical protein